jgi:hypothetical protein
MSWCVDKTDCRIDSGNFILGTSSMNVLNVFSLSCKIKVFACDWFLLQPLYQLLISADDINLLGENKHNEEKH